MAEAPAMVEVRELHTPAMQKAEAAAMLGDGIAVTAGGLLRLWLADSPFVLGGALSEDDIVRARAVFGCPDATAGEIVGALETALRGLEIIQQEDGGPAPSYRGFCPEWFADLYAGVCRAAPATTWAAFLWEMPLATAAHLAAAAHRANGGHTLRPCDWEGALMALDKSSYGGKNVEPQQSDAGHGGLQDDGEHEPELFDLADGCHRLPESRDGFAAFDTCGAEGCMDSGTFNRKQCKLGKNCQDEGEDARCEGRRLRRANDRQDGKGNGESKHIQAKETPRISGVITDGPPFDEAIQPQKKGESSEKGQE